MSVPITKFIMLAGVASVANPVQAQQIDSEWFPTDAAELTAPEPAAHPPKASRAALRPHVTNSPYLQASQILGADLRTGGDVLTYSSVVAGVDTSVETRRSQGQINLRFERRIARNRSLDDQNIVNGIARGAVALSRNVGVEAGGVASRTRVDGRVPTSANFVGNSDNVTQVYSVYGGPTFSAQAGAMKVSVAYRAGYSKVESQRSVDLPEGQQRFNQFDDSVSHVATALVSAGPGSLPFGWAVSGSWRQEKAGQINNQFDARTIRGDLNWPISPNLALVGGVGFEKIKIIERDALRDANGSRRLSPDGRFLVDPTSPKLIAYHQAGLIWDAGVSWRPGMRTSFEARFGRRYGTDSYTGNFQYRPTRDWAIGINVFDVVSGFGGLLNDNLAALPTQFRSPRNPLSGDIGECVFGQAGGSCLNDLLQNASSAAFRRRGVAGAFSGTISRWDSGFALGFNQRTLIASPVGAQGEMDGLRDNSYFALASLGRAFGQRTRFESSIYANYFDSGFEGAFDTFSAGANAAFYRQIIRGLSASAAVGLDHSTQETVDSTVTASALLGLKYSF